MQAYFELSTEYDTLLIARQGIDSFCPPHFHSSVEIIFIKSGEMEITINGETRLLSESCATIANSYDIHINKTPVHSDARILVIPITMLSRFEVLMKNKRFNSPFLMPGVHVPDLDYAIEKLVKYHGTRGTLTSIGLLYYVLGIFIDNLGTSALDEEAGTVSLVRDMLIYLEGHFTEPLTLDDLAKQCGYSKPYVSKLINSALGCGFSRYINILRVRHAARLIRNTDDSFEEIAFQSGFQNVRNLNRYFQLFYHTTPKEYKNLEDVNTEQ